MTGRALRAHSGHTQGTLREHIGHNRTDAELSALRCALLCWWCHVAGGRAWLGSGDRAQKARQEGGQARRCQQQTEGKEEALMMGFAGVCPTRDV